MLPMLCIKPCVQGVHKVWVHMDFHYLFYLFRLFFLSIDLFIQMLTALPKAERIELLLFRWTRLVPDFMYLSQCTQTL